MPDAVYHTMRNVVRNVEHQLEHFQRGKNVSFEILNKKYVHISVISIVLFNFIEFEDRLPGIRLFQ